jgi:hypothetical protein
MVPMLRWAANCLTARGSSGRRTATACPVLQDDRQAAGLPFSSVATVPAAASWHDATSRASNGVPSSATSPRATNANPGKLAVRQYHLLDLRLRQHPTVVDNDQALRALWPVRNTS